jgi:hypothetical protein
MPKNPEKPSPRPIRNPLELTDPASSPEELMRIRLRRTYEEIFDDSGFDLNPRLRAAIADKIVDFWELFADTDDGEHALKRLERAFSDMGHFPLSSKPHIKGK